MKKFLTQQINFTYAVIVMLALVVGVGTVAAVAPGGSIDPIIHRGGGDQAIERLKVGNALGTLGILDVRQNDTLSHFVNGQMVVQYPSGIEGQLFIGENVSNPGNIWDTVYSLVEGNLAPVLQRVNVDGAVRATNLDNLFDPTDNSVTAVSSRTNQTGSDTVCVDPEGVLQLCTESAISIAGSCGASAGTSSYNPPSTDLCTDGSPSLVTTSGGSYSWTCFGDGGADVSCSANQLAPASCGSAAGVMTGTPPTTNLCNPGTATTVNLVSGFYRWSCNEGTTTSDCSARRVTTAINGQCQSFPSAYSSQPANSTNACTTGTYVDTTDTASNWQWECQGSNGGTTDSCSATTTSTPTLGQYQCSAAGTWSSAGTCNPSTEFPAWNGGTTYGLNDSVCATSAPANSTCVSGTGACEGTYTITATTGTQTEVDWNGNPFDWQSGAVYSASGTLIAQCINSNLSFNPTPTAREYLRSTNGTPYGPDIVYPMGGQQRSYYCNRFENYESVMYTSGFDGQWRRLNANTVGWESQIMSVDRLGNYFQTSGGSTGGQVIQCSTLTSYGESYCESYPDNNTTCTWNPNG